MFSYEPDGSENGDVTVLTSEEEELSGDSLNGTEHSSNIQRNLEENPCSLPLGIVRSFIPDINETASSEYFIRPDKFLSFSNFQFPRYSFAYICTSVYEQEGLRVKVSTDRKFFQYGLNLLPFIPEIFNDYAEFLEEKDNDIIAADHSYVRALLACPCHEKASANRDRTRPLVEVLDRQELDRIDTKRHGLIYLNHTSPKLREIKKEVYILQIHHTLALGGNTMTLAETRTVLESGLSLQGKSVMEHNEILGMDLAFRFMNEILVDNSRPISVSDILQIHSRVLGNVDPLKAGKFRQNQVFVDKHVPPPPHEVENLMNLSADWLQSANMLGLHPIKRAALAHYRFAYIHPFEDGNGRTARLIMNLMLMRAGYPPVIIRKEERSVYHKTLQLINEGDARPFIRFIAHCTDCTLNVFLNTTDYHF